MHRASADSPESIARSSGISAAAHAAEDSSESPAAAHATEESNMEGNDMAGWGGARIYV
jgi:hypothetical protein